MPGFVIETVIHSPADDLPERVLCVDGVNKEFQPLVRMTAPAEWRRNLRDWPTGLPLFTSLLNRCWRHCRTITQVDGGYLVRDQVEFTSRLPGSGHILAPGYRAVFAHRHRGLRRMFDAAG